MFADDAAPDYVESRRGCCCCCCYSMLLHLILPFIINYFWEHFEEAVTELGPSRRTTQRGTQPHDSYRCKATQGTRAQQGTRAKQGARAKQGGRAKQGAVSGSTNKGSIS